MFKDNSAIFLGECDDLGSGGGVNKEGKEVFWITKTEVFHNGEEERVFLKESSPECYSPHYSRGKTWTLSCSKVTQSTW